jgi:hypothetical protein
MILKLWVIVSQEEEGSPIVYWTGEYFADVKSSEILLFSKSIDAHCEANMIRKSEGMGGHKVFAKMVRASFKDAEII